MKKVILLITMCMILFSLVGAVPPSMTSFVGTEGLDVQANFLDYYKIKSSVELQIYVFNISNGAIMSNLTTSCKAELTNASGEIIFTGTAASNGNHFKMSRNSSIVTEKGLYAVTLICNTSTLGGYKTFYFEATETGTSISTSQVLLYLGLLGIFIFLFIVNLGVIPFLPKGDNKDEEGVLISINHLKYIRPILYVTAYLFLMIIVFVSSNLALIYLGTELIGDVLFKIFYMMMAFALPMLTIWFIYIIYSIFQDKKMKEYIERGIINEKIPDGKW